MFSENQISRQKTLVFTVAFLFLTLGMGVASENAQTKSTKKTATSSAAKKPTPAPKKTDKKDSKTIAKNSKASTDKKNVDKKDAKSTQKSTTAKSNSTKSNGKNSTAKGLEKPNLKSASKTTAQKTKPDLKNAKSSSVSTTSKTAKKPVEIAKTASIKTRKIASKPAVQSENKDLGQAIVTVASARVRTEPRTNASEVRKIKLGTLLKVVEENPSWYKVEFSGSSKPSSGWMSKQVAGDFNENNRTEIYRQIVDRNYKEEKMTFADASELYDFLTRAQDELSDSNAASEIDLKRLLALRSALRAIPFGKSDEKPYSDFLKANNKMVVYSEPSGEWYVRSESLWDLQKKHSKDAIAEEIAWTAAQNPLPGECEGYINCYLFVLRETDGEYLTLYPSGKYAQQSLKNIQSLIEPIAADIKEKTVYNGPSDVSDRAEFNRLVAELRTIVSKLPFAEIEKQKTIQQLNKIAEGYR